MEVEVKRLTRRQIRSWLAPMRHCFYDMKDGYVDAIRGYAVTRLDHNDEYARTDYCIAGFRALINRLCARLDDTPLVRVEKRLAAGAPLTVDEIDAALAFLRTCEDALIRCSVSEVKSAVLTEQLAIELDERMAA